MSPAPSPDPTFRILQNHVYKIILRMALEAAAMIL